MSQTIIVVPCYNEARRLDTARFLDFAREDRRHKFLFVDDGSTDETLHVLETLRRAEPESFAVLALPRNAGKAEAVRRGILRALEDGPEYVGYWDADLATPLDTVVTFRSLLDSRPDIEVVFGTRVALLGRSVERQPLRHYLGRVFATAASLALGIGFYDTQCGAKLFRASDEVAALFGEPFRTRWIFDVEIIARLIAGRRGTGRPRVERIVYEYPLHEWHDVAGSKVRPRDYARSLFGLLAIHWHYGARTAPALRTDPASAVPGRPARPAHRGRTTRHGGRSSSPSEPA